jgi:hypothetical protein
LSSSVLRSTSKNSSRGFCAFLTADVDAAAEEKSRLPSALDRDSITAAKRIRESGQVRYRRRREVGGGFRCGLPAKRIGGGREARDPRERWGEGL